MNHHPFLSRSDIEAWGPEKIMQRISGEFLHASQKARFTEIVIASYHRARELMGILEIIPFQASTAIKLKPFYRICRIQNMFIVDHLQPLYVEHFAAGAARAFKKAAEELAHA